MTYFICGTVDGIVVVWNLYTWSLANDRNHSLTKNFTQVYKEKKLRKLRNMC